MSSTGRAVKRALETGYTCARCTSDARLCAMLEMDMVQTINAGHTTLRLGVPLRVESELMSMGALALSIGVRSSLLHCFFLQTASTSSSDTRATSKKTKGRAEEWKSRAVVWNSDDGGGGCCCSCCCCCCCGHLLLMAVVVQLVMVKVGESASSKLVDL